MFEYILKPELTGMASLARQFALEIQFLPLTCWNYRWGHHAQLLFTGVQSIWTLIPTWQAHESRSHLLVLRNKKYKLKTVKLCFKNQNLNKYKYNVFIKDSAVLLFTCHQESFIDSYNTNKIYTIKILPKIIFKRLENQFLS